MKNKPVLILGATGTGKTSGAHKTVDLLSGNILGGGLPPSRTLILNAEVKSEPVILLKEDGEYTPGVNVPYSIEARRKEVVDFVFNVMKHIKYSKSVEELEYWRGQCSIAGLPDMSEIDFVVVDSASAIMELINTEELSKKDKRAAWGVFAVKLIEWVRDIKEYPYQIFMTGLPTRSEGEDKDCMAVRGQAASNGAIEKEFMFVAWTKQHKYTGGDWDGYVKLITYRFAPNVKDTARAPLGMFEFDEEANFMNIYDKINIAYNLPEYTCEGFTKLRRTKGTYATYQKSDI